MDMLNRLPDGIRVIAWNAPGYPGSTALEKDAPVASDYAGALLDFLDAIQIDRVNLVGHSLGTLIGAALAKSNPERIRLLVLASCASGYRAKSGAPLGEKLLSRIADLGTLGADQFAKLRAPRLVFEPQNNPDVVTKVQRNMARVNPAGYTQAVRMLASADLASTMKYCTVPTRFIVAADDQITPESQTLAAAAAWSEAYGEAATIERIANAGHAVYVQKPAEFANLVMKLVTDV